MFMTGMCLGVIAPLFLPVYCNQANQMQTHSFMSRSLVLGSWVTDFILVKAVFGILDVSVVASCCIACKLLRY